MATASAGRSVLLASGSPQRRAILTQVGASFRVVVPDTPEETEGDPHAVVATNARRKADAGALVAEPGEVVLAVDTEVVLGGVVYGKPADGAAARGMLLELRGRTHEVLGGLCMLVDGQRHELVATTRVTFRAFSDAFLERYLAGGEWAGRAGGYAIQGTGAAIVASIEGDWQNVVGLPLTAWLDLLDELGLGDLVGAVAR
jgi:septum formation protein